jgi:hypothetical protein
LYSCVQTFEPPQNRPGKSRKVQRLSGRLVLYASPTL